MNRTTQFELPSIARMRACVVLSVVIPATLLAILFGFGQW